MTRNRIILRIVRAASLYSGCPDEEILASDRGTLLAQRTRALAWSIAMKDTRLKAMSDADLKSQFGKRRSWDPESVIGRIGESGWFKSGVAFVEGELEEA